MGVNPCRVIQESMSLKYEPVSEPLHKSCITQLKVQGPFRSCNESKEEEEERVHEPFRGRDHYRRETLPVPQDMRRFFFFFITLKPRVE